MIVGNLLAIPQRSVKRMLAYSSIAHAGYLLAAVAAAAHPEVRAAAGEGLLFYLASYTVMGIGAFAVVAALERRRGEGPLAWDLDRFAGLAKAAGARCGDGALHVLAGRHSAHRRLHGEARHLPRRGRRRLCTLAVLGVLTSVAGVYYYLRVVVYMYMREREPSVGELPAPQLTMGVALAAAAIGTLILGIARASSARSPARRPSPSVAEPRANTPRAPASAGAFFMPKRPGIQLRR